MQPVVRTERVALRLSDGRRAVNPFATVRRLPPEARGVRVAVHLLFEVAALHPHAPLQPRVAEELQIRHDCGTLRQLIVAALFGNASPILPETGPGIARGLIFHVFAAAKSGASLALGSV